MISKIEISLWDIFVTLGTGIVAVFFVTGHLLLWGIDLEKLKTIKDISSIILLFVMIPSVFIIGILFDGLVIVISSNTIEKIFKVGKPSEYCEKLNQILKDKHIPKDVSEHLNPYFWCKDYVIQNKIDTPFMVFLSKFGFYRNIAFLFYLNALIFIIFLIIEGNIIISIAVIVGSITLGIIFSFRSKKFYLHMEKAIYGNYFVAFHSATLARQAAKDSAKV